MRGHEEAPGTKYVPKALMEKWAKKDPIQNYEEFLLEEGVISEDFIQKTRADIKQQINEGLDIAFSEPDVEANYEKEVDDLFAPYTYEEQIPSSKTSEKRFVDAISDGLRQSMEKHDQLVLMGQDIADYGGVFKITDGFTDLRVETVMQIYTTQILWCL